MRGWGGRTRQVFGAFCFGSGPPRTISSVLVCLQSVLQSPHPPAVSFLPQLNPHPRLPLRSVPCGVILAPSWTLLLHPVPLRHSRFLCRRVRVHPLPPGYHERPYLHRLLS